MHIAQSVLQSVLQHVLQHVNSIALPEVTCPDRGEASTNKACIVKSITSQLPIFALAFFSNAQAAILFAV